MDYILLILLGIFYLFDFIGIYKNKPGAGPGLEGRKRQDSVVEGFHQIGFHGALGDTGRDHRSGWKMVVLGLFVG